MRLKRWQRKPPPAAELTDAAFGIEPPFSMGRDWERGVEYGLLFARVKDFGSVRMAVHADLAEVVMRLAEHERLPFSAGQHVHGEECRAERHDDEDYMDVAIGWPRYGC